jgi:hypothetical protein
VISFRQFILETIPGFGDAVPKGTKLARIEKDENGHYHFISPSGKEVLRVNDLKRAKDWKMYYMRKKRWKFKGNVNEGF